MALSSNTGKKGFTPKQIHTDSGHTRGDRWQEPHYQDPPDTKAVVPEISDETFQEIAAAVKESCPASAALASTSITLTARLLAESKTQVTLEA